MIRRYDFAPLDGITKVVFRQVYHRLFGGADRYFIPFFSPTDQHILTKRDQRELDPAANAGLHVVPQVMTRRAPDFLWAAEVVADMGYTEVNLNLGCPSGTVTAKGKGSGLLARREELEGLLDADAYSVLLAHRPELIETYAAYGADLVLSGHAHGGQVRLPFIGALYAPGQGFLPEYDSGLYTVGKTDMIVSRGLGNSLIPLRVNNRPELVIAVLHR